MNELTIEQLKSLEVGDWVWITQDKRGCYAEIQHNDENGLNVVRGKFCYWMNYSDYGTKWVAYKNKEETENKSIPFDIFVKMWSDIEGDDLPCNFGIFEHYVLKTNPQWCKEHISDCEHDNCCWKKLIEEIIKQYK